MEKTANLTESSELYRKIDVSGLSAIDRQEALGALRVAETFVALLDGVRRVLGLLPNWGRGNVRTKASIPATRPDACRIV